MDHTLARHYLTQILLTAIAETPLPHDRVRQFEAKMILDAQFEMLHLPERHQRVADYFAAYLLEQGVLATDIKVLFHFDKESTWYTMHYNVMPG